MRKLKIMIGVTVALVVGWILFASFNIYNPSQGDVDARTDTVLSLSPPPYRFPFAEELHAEGHAENLAISFVPVNPLDYDAEWIAAWGPAESYCVHEPSNGEDNIWCFTPDEISTRGEARALRELAEANSWDSVTVVTSSYHVFRTRFIFQQCAGDTVHVNVVHPEPDLSVERSEETWGWHIAYENIAFIKALYETAVGC